MIQNDLVPFLIFFGVVFIYLVVVGVILFLTKKNQKKYEIENIVSLVSMYVTVPKEAPHSNNREENKNFKDLIAPMEQFLSSLTMIVHKKNYFDWQFNAHQHISFEIITSSSGIVFVVVVPKKIMTIVERQIQSFYPHAEISFEKPPALITKESQEIAGAVLNQSKSYILPIKTYQHLEADPLASITNVLTKLTNHSKVGIQVLIRPVNESWRKGIATATGHVSNNKIHLINPRSPTTKTIGFIKEVISSKKTSDTPKSNTPEQESLLKALSEKGSKTAFEVIIRILVVSKTQEEADSYLTTIINAFSQYYTPQVNSFKYKKNNDKKIAKDYLLRLFNNAPKMILNVEEIASVFHFPSKTVETPGIKWITSRSLPAPPNLSNEGVVIGESIYRGVKNYVRLKEPDRLRHIFMIGKTGTGKTTLFETMIEQDMVAGKGLCFIDPLGDAVESLIRKVPTERAKDVILFDPSDFAHPLGLNLLDWKKPEDKDFLIQEVIEIFYKLFDPNRTGIVGPQWEHWARNAALTVMSQPGGGSLIDIPRLFTDDGFRTSAVACVTDPIVKAFWEKQLEKTADFHKSEMYNYFISKFGRFLTNDLMRNIIGQKENSFDLREIMDSGKILFVNLAKGKIGEINSNLLGLILVSKIQVSAFSRADIPEKERRPFYLYVDEFQNFTTDTFATILSEARKYGLSLNITNQYIAQLTERIRDAVIGNAGTIISYRIGAEDAEYLTRELVGVSIEDMTNLERFHAYIKLLVDLTPTKVFSMKGIKTDNVGSNEMADWIRNSTRHQYSKKPIEFKNV